MIDECFWGACSFLLKGYFCISILATIICVIAVIDGIFGEKEEVEFY